LVAGLCTALYQVFFFAGVERAGVAIGTLVALGSGPILTGVLARLHLGERPGRSWLVATSVCLTGLSALVLGGSPAGTVDVLGAALALLAGLSYAAYTVLAKQQLDAGHRPTVVMAAAFGLGGLLSLPLLMTQPLDCAADAGGVLLALYLGLVTVTVGYRGPPSRRHLEPGSMWGCQVDCFVGSPRPPRVFRWRRSRTLWRAVDSCRSNSCHHDRPQERKPCARHWMTSRPSRPRSSP
jgi:hypothetical protein